MPSGTIIDNKKDVYDYPSRSSRNSKLYREVYGKYENLDNLPLDDNTDEIDMEKLRELVYNSESSHEFRELRDNLDIIDVKKRNIDTERVHDINKILEKAKYENNKLKEPVINTSRNKSILSTLQMKVINDDIDNSYQEVVTKTYEDNDNIYMTREFKFKELNDKIAELNSNPLLDNVMEDNELSLDLFEDLKPVGDTIITEPIVEREEEKKTYNNDYKGDMYSSDTSDIDVIKDVPKPNPKINSSVEEDFFTNSYAFSNKDFNSNNEEEFFTEKTDGGSAIKIILLLLAIAVFIFVIVYFVMTYGIGV